MDRCFWRRTIALQIALLGIMAFMLPSFLSAQDLSLTPDDLLIELRPDGGYHLFVRCKPDISSVLVTETTRDPLFRADNYAYRTLEKNSINGDEIRIIDGYPIPKENRIYSLISSTPEQHPVFGWAYHIYIPHILYFGYEGGRNGEVSVGDGTYLNLRTFYYAYADYRGPFKDNPFELRVIQEPPQDASKEYMRETVAAFTEIARGKTAYSEGPADIVKKIEDILAAEIGNDVDLVICLDTTGSMRPYIDTIRTQLITMLQELTPQFASFRIGMVLFRDYHDEYLNRVIPFTNDFNEFQRHLNAVRTAGGGDIPEAVYEALRTCILQFAWKAPSKIIILIGDSPPHPRPRGKITKAMVESEAARQEIETHAIILPSLK